MVIGIIEDDTLLRKALDVIISIFLRNVLIFCWQESLANLEKARGVGKNIKQEKSMWILC